MNPETVLSRLSSSIGQRSEGANQHLAAEIAEKSDSIAVSSLIELLQEGKASVKNDCIKVLYEIGESKPKLIQPHAEVFLALLTHKNNRLQWGAMTAIASVAEIDKPWLHEKLPQIMEACERGSVITRDSTVRALLSLAKSPDYYEDAMRLLFELLLKSPVNQLPMYAENILPVVNASAKEEFSSILGLRIGDVEKESKRKRIEKVLRKLDRV